LQSNRVTLGGEDLLSISESDVLETVDLTKGPENIILILAPTFDLEFACVFLVHWKAISHSIQELGFRDGSRLKFIQVSFNIRLGIGGSSGSVKQSELADKILVALIHFGLNTVSSVLMPVVSHRQFGEEPGHELG
jgi:hypothetical protein